MAAAPAGMGFTFRRTAPLKHPILTIFTRKLKEALSRWPGVQTDRRTRVRILVNCRNADSAVRVSGASWCFGQLVFNTFSYKRECSGTLARNYSIILIAGLAKIFQSGKGLIVALYRVTTCIDRSFDVFC